MNGYNCDKHNKKDIYEVRLITVFFSFFQTILLLRKKFENILNKRGLVYKNAYYTDGINLIPNTKPSSVFSGKKVC